MSPKFFGMILLISGLIAPSIASARVRTVYTNDTIMSTIYLSMGQSTVLRFREKPNKVVVGNGNYFNIEYIDSDIAIQPLGKVDSNLFVYGEYHTYGLILRVRNSSSYDDLVNVRWKSKYDRPPLTLRRNIRVMDEKPTGLKFHVGDLYQITVDRIFKSEKQKFYVLDLTVKYLGVKEQDLSDFKVTLTRRNKLLKTQRTILSREKIEKNGSFKVRTFVSLEKRVGFTLNVKMGSRSGRIIIGRNKL